MTILGTISGRSTTILRWFMLLDLKELGVICWTGMYGVDGRIQYLLDFLMLCLLDLLVFSSDFMFMGMKLHLKMLVVTGLLSGITLDQTPGVRQDHMLGEIPADIIGNSRVVTSQV